VMTRERASTPARHARGPGQFDTGRQRIAIEHRDAEII